MTEERTRTDWKAKFEALSVEHEQAKKEVQDTLSSALNLGKENDQLRDEISDLKRQVERARLQGMNDVTALLLRDGQ